jgi:cobalt/nickel transport system permease protein
MVWAVHLPDGVLSKPWVVGGFALAGCLAFASVVIDLVLDRLRVRRFREEEIAQLALVTAAFFVATLIHVPLPPTSAHLLLNGLVGVILAWRAAVAIPLGLFLQAALLGHGGFTTLGVNSCVLVLPALLAWLLFRGVQRLPFVRRPWWCSTLVTMSVLAWTLSLVYSVVLLATNWRRGAEVPDPAFADEIVLHPTTLLVALGLAVLAARFELRLKNAPEFAVGLAVGEVAVLATVLLNYCVLWWGGLENWQTLALVVLVAHLPIAVIEGVVLGFVVAFLAQVKPELIGLRFAGAHAPAPSSDSPAVNGRMMHDPSRSLAAPPCTAPQSAGDAQPV